MPKEITCLISRLEDQLVGDIPTTEDTTVLHMIRRVEYAREAISNIIKLSIAEDTRIAALEAALAAARAENERMERDVRHWANEFSAKFGNYSRVDEYLKDLRASIALRARPDDGRVERAARVLFDARYPEHDHEHRDWHDMAGSERFHVQARTILAAADGEEKP